MESDRSADVIVAGGGIAGLTAALAFAQRGFSVQVFERSEVFAEVGAGLQLSPNATRILDRLGVLAALEAVAVRPHSVVLRDAGDLRVLAKVPLDADAEARWKAPYLVVHRADLQQALLAAASRHDAIRLATGTGVRAVQVDPAGIEAAVESGSSTSSINGRLVVGADGVWSKLRAFAAEENTDSFRYPSRFAGHIAWRRTIAADSATARDLKLEGAVHTFLHQRFHLVAYPIRAGREVNLVAFTSGKDLPEDWAAPADPAPLRAALARTAAPLAALREDAGAWTAWPIHTAPPDCPWTRASKLALIGDAAHAMTPFAAQGAAMAIEDAWTLAAVFGASDGLAPALDAWERARRHRIRRVARRGAFNRFVWHAAGPVAWARDRVLAARSPESLSADLDWLYGWDPDSPQRQ